VRIPLPQLDAAELNGALEDGSATAAAAGSAAAAGAAGTNVAAAVAPAAAERSDVSETRESDMVHLLSLLSRIGSLQCATTVVIPESGSVQFSGAHAATGAAAGPAAPETAALRPQIRVLQSIRPPEEAGGYLQPEAMALDAVSGFFLVCDRYNHRLCVHSLRDGSFVRALRLQDASGAVNYPVSVAYSRTLRILVVVGTRQLRAFRLDDLEQGEPQFLYELRYPHAAQPAPLVPQGLPALHVAPPLPFAAAAPNAVGIVGAAIPVADGGAAAAAGAAAGALDDDRKLSNPWSVAIDDSLSLLYVTEDHYISIWHVCSGRFVSRFGALGARDGELDCPLNLTFLPQRGMVAVTDKNNNRVCLFQRYVDVSRTLVSSGGGRSGGGGADGSDDSEVVSVSHTFLRTFGAKGDGPGEFRLACGICADERAGVIFVTDVTNSTLQLFEIDTGRFVAKFFGSAAPASTAAAGAGGVLAPKSSDALLDAPTGVVLHAETGELYLVDRGNSRVMRVALQYAAPQPQSPLLPSLPTQPAVSAPRASDSNASSSSDSKSSEPFPQLPLLPQHEQRQQQEPDDSAMELVQLS
jgi:hypothetical protein